MDLNQSKKISIIEKRLISLGFEEQVEFIKWSYHSTIIYCNTQKLMNECLEIYYQQILDLNKQVDDNLIYLDKII